MATRNRRDRPLWLGNVKLKAGPHPIQRHPQLLGTVVKRGFFSTTRTDNNNVPDPICELASSTLRFGPSATSELGHDLAYINAKRILLFVDPHIRTLEPFANVMSSIERHAPPGHEVDVYD